ncbi:MAG: cytochrome c oxidase assembly protein, partial [Micrococcales bacterium]
EPGSNLKLVSRYSSLALFGFALVAVSGIASASVRLRLPQDLGSDYGRLVVIKAVALVALGLIGAWYRLRLIGRMADNSVYWRDRVTVRTPANRAAAKFWALVGAEVALMAFAMGMATALSRTAPPDSGVDLSNPTPAQILTGEKLPPELTPIRWFTEFKIDLIWLLVGVVAIGAYLVGVWRLNRRGDKWPVARTAAWLGGMLLLLYITNGSMNVYEQYLFSVHMIAHMMLTMAVPTLLVMGAPVTLLMRAVAKRTDDTQGVREWVLWLVHTPYARFISHPIVAAINFASSLVVFYFTPLFSFSMREHIGHEWMVAHFLITGYLFVQALVGIDPGPPKVGYPIRLMILIGTLTFHAFFGLALMQGDALILADWFGAMGRTWGEPPLADQKTGGAIAWGVGELPSAVLTLIVSVQWARSDTRESRRLDRASDRTGNQDIEAYNQMLAKLAEREQRRN